MVQIIRKNENEFVCIFDQASLLESVGVNANQVRKSVEATQRLATYAIDVVVRKYDLAAQPTEFQVTICEEKDKSEPNVMALVKYLSCGADIEEDEDTDEDEDVVEDYYDEGHVEQGEIALDVIPADYAVYTFSDVEDIIRMQNNTKAFDFCACRLFHLNGKYIALVEEIGDQDPNIVEDLLSIFAEYATLQSGITAEYLEEYGKFITNDIPKMVDILEGRNA